MCVSYRHANITSLLFICISVDTNSQSSRDSRSKSLVKQEIRDLTAQIEEFNFTLNSGEFSTSGRYDKRTPPPSHSVYFI